MCENSDLSKVLADWLDSFVIPSGHVALSTSGVTMIMSETLPDGRTGREPTWHLSAWYFSHGLLSFSYKEAGPPQQKTSTTKELSVYRRHWCLTVNQCWHLWCFRRKWNHLLSLQTILIIYLLFCCFCCYCCCCFGYLWTSCWAPFESRISGLAGRDRFSWMFSQILFRNRPFWSPGCNLVVLLLLLLWLLLLLLPLLLLLQRPGE